MKPARPSAASKALRQRLEILPAGTQDRRVIFRADREAVMVIGDGEALQRFVERRERDRPPRAPCHRARRGRAPAPCPSGPHRAYPSRCRRTRHRGLTARFRARRATTHYPRRPQPCGWARYRRSAPCHGRAIVQQKREGPARRRVPRRHASDRLRHSRARIRCARTGSARRRRD